MPQIAAAMITAGKKRPPLIEYLIRKTAPTGTNKGQGRLIVCDLRARRLPTFHPTELWLANCENRLRCRTPFDSTTAAGSGGVWVWRDDRSSCDGNAGRRANYIHYTEREKAPACECRGKSEETRKAKAIYAFSGDFASRGRRSRVRRPVNICLCGFSQGQRE
jgi:hypothetical protein